MVAPGIADSQNNKSDTIWYKQELEDSSTAESSELDTDCKLAPVEYNKMQVTNQTDRYVGTVWYDEEVHARNKTRPYEKNKDFTRKFKDLETNTFGGNIETNTACYDTASQRDRDNCIEFSKSKGTVKEIAAWFDDNDHDPTSFKSEKNHWCEFKQAGGVQKYNNNHFRINHYFHDTSRHVRIFIT